MRLLSYEYKSCKRELQSETKMRSLLLLSSSFVKL